MSQDKNIVTNEKAGLVLVVDDDPSTRILLQNMLIRDYEVETAESGADALQILGELSPDLIVLDIEMPGLDGYETCRRIRESSHVPIMFATSHSSLESQLEAFEAGANDIVTKPVAQDLFLKKTARAIQTHLNWRRLHLEKNSFQNMAMNLLSSVDETGILLNFLRTSIQCRSFYELAARLADAARMLDMQCYGVIRTSTGDQYFRSDGEPTGLEKDVLAKVSTMGRVFQFKRQLVVNCDHVSIIATNVPIESPEKTSTFRDNLTVLAETAEALAENVEMRQESMARAEQLQIALMGASGAVQSLQDQHRQMLADTRMLLQELVENIEKSFSWLGTTTDQEVAINNTMNQSVEQILELLSTRGQFETEFATVLGSLRGPESQGDVDLF
ncbi:MAG: response regulator [Azonexus sp.]|jgi:CheY-like chemotaxis protein|nr:response regulator [Azonexus sp.]